MKKGYNKSNGAYIGDRAKRRGRGRGRGRGRRGGKETTEFDQNHVAKRNICFACGKKGHWSYDCNWAWDPLLQSTCHRCGGVGHKSNQCDHPYNYNGWL